MTLTFIILQFCSFSSLKAEGNQNLLQEEVSRMVFQLEEERKVTANMSKSLELEKRKVESLEQRAKHNGSSRGSREAENNRRRSSLLPDTVKDAEEEKNAHLDGTTDVERENDAVGDFEEGN